MSVVCTACKTENRDNAMFCRGCAGKLPGFAATGPSALEGMKAWRPPTTSSAPLPPPTPGMLPIESRSFWIRLALLGIAITAAFVCWYAYVTRRVQAPVVPPPALAMAAPARVTAAAAPASVASPTTPVRTTPSDAAETPAAPSARQPPDVLSERWEPSKKATVTAHAGPANPRTTCAHLNFIAAARCEAAQCNKAAYRSHPRCDQVREQRRRDEALRNPTLMP